MTTKLNEVAVFVNTTTPPIKIVRLGLFKIITNYLNERRFQEMCEVYYPHPDAPRMATVMVYRFLEVEVKQPAIFLQAIEAMSELMGICELK